MDHHQHADVLVDRRRVRRDGADVEQLAHLLHARPALAHLTRHRVERGIDRQARQQADDRLLRVAQPVDQARDVVLEKLFLVRLEETDDLATIGRVRAGEPEVQLLAVRADGHRGESEPGRAILVLAEGLRIDDGELDLAIRTPRQLARAARARVARRRAPPAPSCSRLSEKKKYRFTGSSSEPRMRSRARRDRVQPVLRQVEARAAQRKRRQHRDREEQDGEREQCAGAAGFSCTSRHGSGLNRLS